ncbi:MAG: gas vesicle protein GvpG [Acidobacteriota bacterium]
MVLRSLLWLAREVEKAAREQQAEDRESILLEVRQLMARLESGEIDEETYERLEDQLMDRLDALDDDDE